MTQSEKNHRRRLLDGLARVLEQKRYQDTTIADIAAAARVSRRTIYEHFPNKEACLLALAEQTSQQVMEAIQSAVDPDGDWGRLVRDTTAAYLQLIDQRPQQMKALYLELGALGEPGVAMRRQVAGQFADFMRALLERSRIRGEPLQPLDRSMAMALVAGINELILYALHEDEHPDLMSLAPAAETLVRRVTMVPEQ